VTSYQALIGPPVEPAQGTIDDVTCDTIGGWTASPTYPDVAIEARLYFDGEKGDGATVGHPILADFARDACGTAGACDNGFEVGPPLSLFDGVEHAVRAYASDGSPASPELAGSPKTMKCSFEVPAGVRRKLEGEDAKTAWRFSTFWDEIGVSAGVLGAVSEGPALDAKPRVVVSATDASKIWIVDRGVRRAALDVRSARAWDLSPIGAEELTDAELAAIPEGAPLRARPIVLRDPEGDLWLVDDADASSPQGTGAGSGDGLSPDGGGPDGDDGGCDCATPGRERSANGAWLLVGLAGLVAARRRRR
jgi:MYXO-CTERM domain-containing protein